MRLRRFRRDGVERTKGTSLRGFSTETRPASESRPRLYTSRLALSSNVSRLRSTWLEAARAVDAGHGLTLQPPLLCEGFGASLYDRSGQTIYVGARAHRGRQDFALGPA